MSLTKGGQDRIRKEQKLNTRGDKSADVKKKRRDT